MNEAEKVEGGGGGENSTLDVLRLLAVVDRSLFVSFGYAMMEGEISISRNVRMSSEVFPLWEPFPSLAGLAVVRVGGMRCP